MFLYSQAMILILDKTEPPVGETMKKGNSLLQLVDSPEEPAMREEMASLAKELPVVKKKLEQKQAFLETVVEKNVEFQETAEQLEDWIAATAKQPVLVEGTKITNPIAVEKRLQQLEVTSAVLIYIWRRFNVETTLAWRGIDDTSTINPFPTGLFVLTIVWR